MQKLVYLVSPSERGLLDCAGDRPPLGLLYIAKSLERNGHKVRVFDLNHLDEKVLINYTDIEGPDIIGVSCLTSPIIDRAQNILRSLKGKSRLVVGGYHPTIRPEDFESLDVDHIVMGEGEEAILKIIAETGEYLVPGGEVNINRVGSPSRHLVFSGDYGINMDGMRTTTMMTSRGCPNNCTFCGNPHKRVRFNELEDISEDIDHIKESGYEAVYILDDVFTANFKRAVEIAERLKFKRLPFRATTRVNYMNEGLARELAKNGCHMLSLGIESGNDEILRDTSKRITTADVRKVFHYLPRYMRTKGFFILGLPGETEETAKQTIDLSLELREMGLSSADFYALVPFPGTAIWDNPERFGINILSRDFRKYLQTQDPICETKELKAERIKQLIGEAKSKWAE